MLCTYRNHANHSLAVFRFHGTVRAKDILQRADRADRDPNHGRARNGLSDLRDVTALDFNAKTAIRLAGRLGALQLCGCRRNAVAGRDFRN